jgi:ribonuclease J
MLQLTRPRYFVPVHGEYRHPCGTALAHEGSASPESFVLEDGDALEIDGAGARRGEPVASGRVFVDGKGVGDVGDVLRDRRHFGRRPVLAILAVNQHTGEIISGPTSSRAASSSRTTARRTSSTPRKRARSPARSRVADGAGRGEGRDAEDPRRYQKTLERRPVILPVVMGLTWDLRLPPRP